MRQGRDTPPRPRGTGAIRDRSKDKGKRSWELKYEAGTDSHGRRRTRYISYKGTRREAEAKLRELIEAVAKGTHIAATKTTVSQHVSHRIAMWESSGKIS